MSSRTERSDQNLAFLRGLDVTVTIAAILFWGIVIWWSSTQEWSNVRYAVIFVGGIMTVYALDQSRQALEEGDWIDMAVLLPTSIVLITASVYIGLNFEDVYLFRQGYALEHEYMMARLIIVSLLYLTWREFGNLFLGLVGGVMLYGVYGNHIPGVLGHAGMNELTLLQVTVTDLYGFYGNLTQLTASWIAPFLLYAGLLFGYGAFDLILRIAIVTAKYVKSGVAQTAVLSSAVIGSINGSYTANAAMTGSFTIPTMKDSGMAPHRAAAIESVASTSGQVLPPVMGASAFVMASYLGVPYIDIVIAGLVPAAILVACVGIAVHYVALSDASSQTMEFSEFFDAKFSTSEKVVEGVRFGVPFLVLIYFLGIAQFTVMTSALMTVEAMIITGIGLPVLRSLYESVAVHDSWMIDAEDATSTDDATPEGDATPADDTTPTDDSSPGTLRRVRARSPAPVARIVGWIEETVRTVLRVRPVAEFVTQFWNTVEGFRRGAIILAPIAIILVVISGVVNIFSTTGVPAKIALLLINISGGVLLFAVLLAMVVSILMGIGMPTVAAYVIVAILIAPTLIADFGVAEIAAHYTVFYAAILAGITPPVATAAVVAAGIAEANFWRTCGVAIKIAAPLFVLPVAFVYNPELVFMTPGFPSLITGSLVLLGGITVIYGLNYPFEVRLGRRLGLRLALTALGLGVMVYPSRLLKVAGVVVFAIVFVGEKVLTRGLRLPLLGGVGQ